MNLFLGVMFGVVGGIIFGNSFGSNISEDVNLIMCIASAASLSASFYFLFKWFSKV